MPAVKSDRLAGRKTLKAKDFFHEMEKDQVKKQVDIISLFSHFGVTLKKKGKSHAGLCPFHDDKNPSLSVDRQKGLYHCFGCGESGDVFALVKRMKGVGFTEALAFLKEYSPNGQRSKATILAKLKPAPKGEERSATPSKDPETPLAQEERKELPGISLNAVAAHYRKTLLKHQGARNYLTSRGFTNYELYKRLGMGFSDGSLLSLVSKTQKEELNAKGIITDRGGEFFAGYLTVPFFDETGNVVRFYGRAIDNKRQVKHLYSPGPHKGLVNRKAAKVYREEIILTESALDALSLIHMGIENVIPCYGVNGFTEEHLKLLKDNLVKSVVIAFDADDAGRKATEALKEKLLAEDFQVKVVFPEKGKDWNEALVAGYEKEEVKTLIAEAELLHPEQPKKALEVKKEGPKYVFTFTDISYRLLGVREIFVSNLRVNVRAEKEGEKFIDNVDLYSARSRTTFASSLAHLFGREVSRIEKDLLQMVEHLEKERDKRLAVSEEEKRELTEEERRLGMELLRDPALFERIVTDTETLGYVGEEVNKLLLYLAASSRKLPGPISVLVLSQSAAGKSYLIETIKKLIPPEDVVSMTSLSDQALNYLPENGLLNKFLVMGEAVHGEVIEHQVREMLSEHELSRLVTLKDPKTGELISRMVKKEVIVSAVMSSTNYEVNQENLSRCFVINSDESVSQTKAIHKVQRKKYSLSRYYQVRSEIPKIIGAHHAAQRLLQGRVIVNNFSELLDFPATLMRSRRDHDRFLDLIAGVCFLRQFQKEGKEGRDPATGERFEYIECDMDDYRISYRIMSTILLSTLSAFPKSALELYEALRPVVRKKASEEGLKFHEVTVGQREIREKSGLSQMFVKRNIRILVEYEYVQQAGSAARGSRRGYRLLADEELHLLDLSLIPTPEQMEDKLKNLQSGASGA